MPKKMRSQAYETLAHVWASVSGRSWEQINHCMHDALKLAIGAGMTFESSDFETFSKDFRWGYWIGGSPEWVYTSAIVNENAFCIEAYEQWCVRTPFRGNNVRSRDGGYLHASSVSRQRCRLGVGLGFQFDGDNTVWWVTGFDDSAGVMRVCQYENSWPEGKPKKRRSLSHDDVKELCPAKSKPSKKTVEAVA